MKKVIAFLAFFVSCAVGGTVAQTTDRVHRAKPHVHEEYARRKNPVPMTEQSVQKGKELYGKHCIACHGETGRGGIGPDLTDQVWVHGSSDGEIFQVITAGVTGTTMRGFKEELTEEMRWHLVNYTKSLGKAAGK